MQYADWGERSPRWAGIRSEVIEIRTTRVHLLRANAMASAPTTAPTQLLVHPMGASATYWLDAVGPLTAYGPVVVPDLPGTLVGHTGLPRPGAARAEINARFLRAFTATLGLDRVVVHGWSLGGLVALLFADLEPRRVERLVLVDPALPGSLTAGQVVGWQTLGRLALLAGPWVVRGLLRLFGRRLVDLKLRLSNSDRLAVGRLDVAGGDLSRLSPQSAALLADQIRTLRSQPQRMSAGITAFTSAVAAMYVSRSPAEQAIGRLTAPTLLLWGDQDPFIQSPVIEHVMTRRPDWDLHVFKTVGHLLPLEVPDDYARVVGGWLVAPGAPAEAHEPV